MNLRNFTALLGMLAAICIAAALGTVHGPVAGTLGGVAVFVVTGVALAPHQPTAFFANNFGVLNNTTLVLDAFSQFLENLLPLKNMVLDVQDEKTGSYKVKPGDTITVKDWRSSVTVYQPAASTGYNTLSDVSLASGDRQLTMPNTPFAISIALTPPEYRLLSSGVNSGREYELFRSKLAILMRDGLGKEAIGDWFDVITAANYTTNFVTATGTFARSTEIDLDTKLFGRNVPTDGAQIILSPTPYGEWAKDHIAIQTNTGNDRQKGLLMTGGIQSNNSNFTFWRTNRPMPADAARGFAMGRTAVIAAFRIPDEETYDRDPVSLSELIDPSTGIPMLARVWKNPATGHMQMDLASIWVFGKGQSEALERLTAS